MIALLVIAVCGFALFALDEDGARWVGGALVLTGALGIGLTL